MRPGRVRRWLTAGAAALLTVSALGVLPVDAQEGEPAGFVPGEATAQASTIVLGMSPGGGKPIDVALGRSTARYQNRTATAEGAALGLGLLQIFFGPSSACGDHPPIIPADQLPPVTTNDSRRNQPMTTPLEVRSPGTNGTATTPGQPGGVIGTQLANAAATPQTSSAATTTVSQDYGVLALDGGATSVSTGLVDGVRSASAVTTATRLRVLGDMVVINEPRWEASTTSGGTETATARFTFTSASILGFERTAANFPGDFADFANGVANLLSGLGVTLRYPQVVTEPGRVTITPLVVSMANPPIGLDVIKPLLTFLAPAREEANQKLIAEDCNNQAVLQIVDLVIGILSGTGAVTLSAGGATAFTAATVFPDPPALEVPDLEVPVLEAAPFVAAPPVSVQDSSTFRTPTFTDTSSSSSSGSSLDLGADTVAPLPEVTTIEETTGTETTASADDVPEFELPTATLVSRRFEPGTRGGAAAAVGIAGLVGLAALALADRFVMKRTKREIPG